METFKIEVQEFLARVVKVQAKNLLEAFSKVTDSYEKAEIVLDYNDFVEVNFVNIHEQSKVDEKNELIKEVVEYLYDNEKKDFEKLNKPYNHIYTKLERLRDLMD